MIEDARYDGFPFPPDATGDDLIRAIIQDVNAKLAGNESDRIIVSSGLDEILDREVDKYYADKEQEVIEQYGKDYENNPDFQKDLEAGTLFETPIPSQRIVKEKVVEEVGRERDVPQENIDEINRLFDEIAEKPAFELTPSEPTPEEKIQLARMKGEIKAPEKGVKPKAVIPTEKIKAPTTGKQASLLPPEKGETLDMFEGEPEAKLAEKQKDDTIELFSGIPFHKFAKDVLKPLEALYLKHVGDPLWNFLIRIPFIKEGV